MSKLAWFTFIWLLIAGSQVYSQTPVATMTLDRLSLSRCWNSDGTLCGPDMTLPGGAPLQIYGIYKSGGHIWGLYDIVAKRYTPVYWISRVANPPENQPGYCYAQMFGSVTVTIGYEYLFEDCYA